MHEYTRNIRDTGDTKNMRTGRRNTRDMIDMGVNAVISDEIRDTVHTL